MAVRTRPFIPSIYTGNGITALSTYDNLYSTRPPTEIDYGKGITNAPVATTLSKGGKSGNGFNFGNLLSTIGSIGSAFSPIAGIISGIGSLFGQGNQNEAQLEMQRETNALNYQMWQEQQQHNVEMFRMQNQANVDNWKMQNDANVRNWQMQFDKTNEYNSASAQRERFEDAGLNPYLMMNGGNSGVAQSSSVPSAGVNGATATPAQAIPMQQANPSAFIDPIGLALSNMSESLAQSATAVKSLVDANATAEKTPIEINNIDTDSVKNRAITANTNANTAKTKEETKSSEINNKYLPYLLGNQYKIGSAEYMGQFWQNQVLANQALVSNLTYQDEIDIKRAQRMNLILDNETKSMLLSYMPQQQAAQLELLAMQAYQAYKSGKCSEQQAKYFISGQILNRAQAGYYSQLGGYYNELTKGVKYTNDFNAEKFKRFGEKMFEAAGVAIDLEIATNKNSTNFENMLYDWNKSNKPSDFMKWNYFNYRHLGIKPFIEGKFDFSRELGIPGLGDVNGYHLNIMGGWQ